VTVTFEKDDDATGGRPAVDVYIDDDTGETMAVPRGTPPEALRSKGVMASWKAIKHKVVDNIVTTDTYLDEKTGAEHEVIKKSVKERTWTPGSEPKKIASMESEQNLGPVPSATPPEPKYGNVPAPMPKVEAAVDEKAIAEELRDDSKAAEKAVDALEAKKTVSKSEKVQAAVKEAADAEVKAEKATAHYEAANAKAGAAAEAMAGNIAAEVEAANTVVKVDNNSSPAFNLENMNHTSPDEMPVDKAALKAAMKARFQSLRPDQREKLLSQWRSRHGLDARVGPTVVEAQAPQMTRLPHLENEKMP
jgi:hypothetical protein